MKVHVVRDKAIKPGGASWVAMPDEDIVFMVSAAGVSLAGAEALEKVWAPFVADGTWCWRPGQIGVGPPIRTRYSSSTHLPARGVVWLSVRPHFVRGLLSREHFTPASARGIDKAVACCVKSGWKYSGQPVALGMADEDAGSQMEAL